MHQLMMTSKVGSLHTTYFNSGAVLYIQIILRLRETTITEEFSTRTVIAILLRLTAYSDYPLIGVQKD